MSTPHDPSSSSKLAFLTTDLMEWRFDEATLNWLALTPIKGTENYTVSYLVHARPQREHTISAITARDIGAWLEYTKLYDKTGDEHAPQWTRIVHTSAIVGTRRVITDAPATAAIDVALEQVIILARECGKSDEFAADIHTPLKLLLRLMVREALAEQNREAMRKFTNTSLGHPYELPTTTVKDGRLWRNLPLEDQLRKNEKPLGYVVGILSEDALECLKDVVSHASDFRSALAARRLEARKEDREQGDIDAPLTTGPGREESYWIKQQGVFERMALQAQRALDTHAKVSK